MTVINLEMWLKTLILALAFDHGWVAGKLTFAVMPKSLDNPFFSAARTGCEEQARILGAQCLFTGPDKEDAQVQAQMASELIENKTIDGLAIAPASVDLVSPVIEQAVEAGIPVVTFDTDAPDSLRSAYIGTDNTFFGEEIAKVLIQLKPNGGSYATVGNLNHLNIMQRYNGLRTTLEQDGNWVQLEGSPLSYDKNNLTFAMEGLGKFAEKNPTAIVPVQGGPMRSGSWADFVNKHRKRNITLVSGDAMPLQLDFIARGMVDGLVGQLPYEMGFISVQVLFDLVNGRQPSSDIVGTNVLTHIKVPLILPPLTVDNNLIGPLQYIAYILFGLVAVCCLFAAWWAYRFRNLRVVKVAQPLFLIMVAFGILIMASSLIPLSFDDGGHPDYHPSKTHCTFICMSVPWLCFIGFTVAFSALFSKTWRINRLFHSHAPFLRETVSEKDVLVPFVVLLLANIIVLICWTVLDPLVYIRVPHDGTDGWNRIISTYGACKSDNVVPYLVPLAAINLSVLAIANWQAYEARNIQSEFAESKYIGVTMASMLQASIMGIPILFVVRESPQAFYLVLVFLIFVISMVTLLLIFVPKILFAETFKRRSRNEQMRHIRQSIRMSQKNSDIRRLSSDNIGSEDLGSEYFQQSKQFSTSFGMASSRDEKWEMPEQVTMTELEKSGIDHPNDAGSSDLEQANSQELEEGAGEEEGEGAGGRGRGEADISD